MSVNIVDSIMKLSAYKSFIYGYIIFFKGTDESLWIFSNYATIGRFLFTIMLT